MSQLPKNDLSDLIDRTEKELKDKSELGEVMDNLDQDHLDKETRMSSVDFNTRLIPFEISSIMIIDELTRLGIFPQEAGLTRQKKRLSVSLNGKGREEKVRIIQGERENRTGQGVMNSMAGLFKRQT